MRIRQPYANAIALLLAVLAALVLAACGGTSITQTTGPDDVRCQTTLSAQPTRVGANGGSVSIAVGTTRDCQWTATSDAEWMHVGTRSGQGQATVTATADSNPQGTERVATISINAQSVRIPQDARPCTFSLSAPSGSFPAGGGNGHIEVTAVPGCTWKASTPATWIRVPSDTHTGSGGLDFSVVANDGGPRTATIVVADQSFTVLQDMNAPPPGPSPPPPPSPGCAAMLQPQRIDIGPAASTQSLQLQIGTTCSWTASTSVPWLTIASAMTGTGAATVRVNVAANTDGDRQGLVTIAGAQATIHQTAAAAPCTFSLNPTSASMTSDGGSGRFTVTTQSGCAWSAASNVPWLSITSGASANGTSDVAFTAAANTTTASRTGTITAGGQTFTVTQAAPAPAPCTYSLSPTSQSVTADGGTGTFTVTTTSGCTWTASVDQSSPWISITSGASGSGSGPVAFSVQANSASTARTGTITAAGQTFTVNQAAAAMTCTFAISPSSAQFAASGGTGQFSLATQSSCAWTASSSAAWITLTTTSGTGPGNVGFTVAANSDATSRSGAITVGGQTFTITQSGATPTCTFSLDPSSSTISAAGGQGQFQVITQSGCAWNPTTSTPWITVTSGAGSGTGTVSYTAQPNSDVARSGTISVAGQAFTLSQAGGQTSGGMSIKR